MIDILFHGDLEAASDAAGIKKRGIFIDLAGNQLVIPVDSAVGQPGQGGQLGD